MEEKISPPNDEISLRDLILKTRIYIREIFRLWMIPAVCILLAVGFQLYRYFTFIPLYPAQITFSVDEEEGGSSAGLTGILGQFGLGSVRPSRYNLDKILALSKSRRVIENTLFTSLDIDGRKDFLANHLIREYELEHAIGPDQKEAFFFTHDSMAAFNHTENEMVVFLYNFLIGPPDNPKEALVTADYNEDTNIMSIYVSTTNEALSMALAQKMFESLSEYYVNKSIEKQLKTFNVISAKKDSVLAVLKATEFQLAGFKDSHRGLLMRTDQLTELRLQREITALSAMYAEVLKNTEVADFSLKNKMPFIQVIDSPMSPIYPTQVSLIRKLAIGIIIGGLIGSAIVIGRFIYNDIMSTPGEA
jgi:uncharacterized protein involved in exopolysaccharide biosynthesis